MARYDLQVFLGIKEDPLTDLAPQLASGALCYRRDGKAANNNDVRRRTTQDSKRTAYLSLMICIDDMHCSVASESTM
jgi:hypothetical protein